MISSIFHIKFIDINEKSGIIKLADIMIALTYIGLIRIFSIRSYLRKGNDDEKQQ